LECNKKTDVLICFLPKAHESYSQDCQHLGNKKIKVRVIYLTWDTQYSFSLYFTIDLYIRL